MRSRSRRTFLLNGASLVAATGGAGVGRVLAADPPVRPEDKFDLVIKGGRVVDPSQKLNARRDLGIRFGRVAALAADIPATRANRLIDATDKLVTPGLIDLHAHVFPYGSALGIPADELVSHTGTTTVVSAGDAGANNFAAFRRYVIAQSRTRIFAFVHICNHGLAGFPVPEMLNIEYADVEAAARALAENPDVVLGVKVRMGRTMVGANGLEPLKRAIAATQRAGTKGRVMCHIGDVPGQLADVLNLLRPGDVVTHTFSGSGVSGNNIVQEGKVLGAALAAKKRGVIFDVGHGGGSFDYTIAEPAIKQGLAPDVISSDIHVLSGNTPGMPYLPWVMSKFLNLGFTLDQVIAMTTVNPAKVIGRVPRLGTLQPGAPGDVSILELIDAPVQFVDTRTNARDGKRYLRSVQTVRAGVPFGKPYAVPPFAVY